MNNMQNMEDGKSRKKLLVPLVVLMLCLVAFTGVAYAYSSTLTNTGNTAEVHYLSVTKDSDASALVEAGDAIVEFTDNYTYAVNTPQSNVIKCEIESPVTVATYNLTISSDETSAVDFTVSSSDLAAVKLYEVTVGSTTTTKLLTDVYDVAFVINNTSYDLTLGETAGDTAALTPGDYVVSIVLTKKVTDSEFEVENIDLTADGHSTNTAKTYHNALAASTFTLVFKASAPATTTP